MTRPEYVTDALVTNDDGITTGIYENLVFRSAYQPIYRSDIPGKLVLSGYEGLVRLYKDGAQIDPSSFFNQVPDEDRVFIECMCFAIHLQNYKHINPVNKELFLNVDVSSFRDFEALEREIYFCFSQLRKHGLSNENLVFEILETEVLEIEILNRICDIFRSNGFRFALDDFGTKHSNLQRYFMLKPDIVKIDRTVFAGFEKSAETGNLLDALLAAFKNNGAEILLEGLESSGEIEAASKIGCNLMQGFALSRPAELPVSFSENIGLPATGRRSPLQLVRTNEVNHSVARQPAIGKHR